MFILATPRRRLPERVADLAGTVVTSDALHTQTDRADHLPLPASSRGRPLALDRRHGMWLTSQIIEFGPASARERLDWPPPMA